MRPHRRDMQVIFQDPLASLDPRMTVGDIIGEPLHTFHPELKRDASIARIQEMMAKVGLLPEMINRYPHEFSGGQAQRIGIARAMILNPKLIVCDEPVSALDVSIQAQIVNLLMRLQREFHLSLIFISHDLSVVRHISHRIMVLYLGKPSRNGRPRHALPRPAPSLYEGADIGGPDPRPGPRAGQAAHRPDRRPALPPVAAKRLLLPHPLPARRSDLRRGGAGVRPGSAGAFRGVPFQG